MKSLAFEKCHKIKMNIKTKFCRAFSSSWKSASNLKIQKLFSTIKINSNNESEKEEDSDTLTELQCFLVPTLCSPDLNDCVDAILDKKPSYPDMLNQLALVHGSTKRDCQKHIVWHKACQRSKRNVEKKRKKSIGVRKNLLQKRVLEREFGLQNSWDKEKISCLARKLGLSEDQIYKWQWKRQTKLALSKFGH
jgi:hypothetical protein